MMRHDEFESLCQSISSGTPRRVQHIITHQTGSIISCSSDDFVEVEVDNGEHKSWSKDNIRVLH
ncbi:hypothetical protein [Geoalkalibacter halelectricus]|uniref:Hypervirulence associated protein TUDOR domain-containing protein n=1 Tax=Geoalkalibacter halelectricus TaxID=2847045 RepID=A0ABY5ZK44_9BACT|nr:hypothetical protein [Geoalkalibacter halelectricus]MDO3378004.1 hypothetical protein [Geoalkalibacter halelectricus]UWZ78305.1 hypothetical protein L9S41_11425 [Geoalkalibacter halelectricus]